MEKYHGLKSYYYKYRDPADYQALVEKRQDNELAMHTGLIMSPLVREFRNHVQYEIFLLPAPQILKLSEEIYSISLDIEIRLKQLTEFAQDQLFYNSLIEELYSTNDIEGVRSSRQEISDTVDRLKRNDVGSVRFAGLVKLYENFQKEKYSSIHNVKDFREIWNELVSSEVAPEDQPDGELFRKSAVKIVSGDKIIHRGDEDEQAIITDLNRLIAEMNNEDLPYLPKCFLAHYYFEYIHTFYDGNGRVGRFIVCAYLARKLDRMSAIQFSTSIAKQRQSYYKAFNEMSNQYNQGEGTNFVISMMKLLKAGQIDVIEQLDEGIHLLHKSRKVLDQHNLTEINKEILFVLCQKEIFGRRLSAITDSDLSMMFNLTRYKLNKMLDDLVQQGLIEVKKTNPKTHVLTKKIIEEIFFY
ncbi:Fic family protein [Xylocopilactobacillus apis]|uniref:Fido domain-containing protein n=1 Tax=Xylocopilactobacillus apis TaxID=2932183 RepID=A0AAU9DBJ4_9LACO|nr:Fic family protein [Xylocopilactobacillus apis]BDR57135.1 hypothetical protein KIMC2_16970 [Xylocopilactobacillus apis]